jgi:hypothetical protein
MSSCSAFDSVSDEGDKPPFPPENYDGDSDNSGNEDENKGNGWVYNILLTLFSVGYTFGVIYFYHLIKGAL